MDQAARFTNRGRIGGGRRDRLRASIDRAVGLFLPVFFLQPEGNQAHPPITSSRPVPAGRMIGMTCVGATLWPGLNAGRTSSAVARLSRLTIRAPGRF